MHHIVIDGWSLGLLIREVASLYRAYSQKQASSPPRWTFNTPIIPFGKSSGSKAKYSNNNSATGSNSSPARRPLLPTDRPRPPLQTQHGAQELLQLSPGLTRSLNDLSRREGVTPFMTLLAAWQVLLSRYSNQKDVVVGTDVANRTFSETEALVGFFSNMLVLRTDSQVIPVSTQSLTARA